MLYSHRSNYIHSMTMLQTDVMGLSVRDTALIVVPMFHANAWGLTFACPAVGTKMVMPGPKMDGASIFELLETEAVTFSAAVPDGVADAARRIARHRGDADHAEARGDRRLGGA